VLFRVWHKKTN